MNRNIFDAIIECSWYYIYQVLSTIFRKLILRYWLDFAYRRGRWCNCNLYWNWLWCAKTLNARRPWILLSNWCKAKKLTMNTQKTKCLPINNRIITPNLELKLNTDNWEIEQIEKLNRNWTFKYLRLTIQSSFKWDIHIQNVTNKKPDIYNKKYDIYKIQVGQNNAKVFTRLPCESNTKHRNIEYWMLYKRLNLTHSSLHIKLT